MQTLWPGWQSVPHVLSLLSLCVQKAWAATLSPWSSPSVSPAAPTCAVSFGSMSGLSSVCSSLISYLSASQTVRSLKGGSAFCHWTRFSDIKKVKLLPAPFGRKNYTHKKSLEFSLESWLGRAAESTGERRGGAWVRTEAAYGKGLHLAAQDHFKS